MCSRSVWIAGAIVFQCSRIAALDITCVMSIPPALLPCCAVLCCACAPAAMKLSQEKQQWDHARSDWEHWRSRVQDEMEAAEVG